MTVQTRIDIGEINGERQPPIDRPKLLIESHWSDRDIVVVVLPDGQKLSVVARQLEEAITNARNWSRG